MFRLDIITRMVVGFKDYNKSRRIKIIELIYQLRYSE